MATILEDLSQTPSGTSGRKSRRSNPYVVAEKERRHANVAKQSVVLAGVSCWTR